MIIYLEQGSLIELIGYFGDSYLISSLLDESGLGDTESTFYNVKVINKIDLL